jgi:hypothetical protein
MRPRQDAPPTMGAGRPRGISAYHAAQALPVRAICDRLADVIDAGLPDAEARIWHAHPVWFLDGNPTVGYAVRRDGVRLMFWSGASFDEERLLPGTGKFKDASITYADVAEVKVTPLRRWLRKSREIQWDYKNVVRRRGRLERLR